MIYKAFRLGIHVRNHDSLHIQRLLLRTKKSGKNESMFLNIENDFFMLLNFSILG